MNKVKKENKRTERAQQQSNIWKTPKFYKLETIQTRGSFGTHTDGSASQLS